MSNPLVSIIIVNWNGGEILADCFRSLKNVIYNNWELIVVDNGSQDGSNNLVKDFFLPKKYILIENLVNIGFAPANNQGVEKAQGKYILLLNNDTKVKPDLLSKLVNKMEQDSSIGVVQPKIYLMDNPKFLDNAGSFLTRIGFLEHWGFMKKDGPQFNKEREIFSAKGACMLIKKSLVDEIGLFDGDFFSYFEESDFCWRVWLKGLRVLFVPSTSIFHKVGFSSKRQNQIFVNFHSLKNMMATFIKNLELINLFTIGGTYLFLIIGLSFFYFFKLRINQALMIYKAIGWNIINLPGILSKRRRVQKMRVLSDQQIFKMTMHRISLQEMFSHFQKVEVNFK